MSESGSRNNLLDLAGRYSHAFLFVVLEAVSGCIKGLRARGNFGVDITWQGGRLQEACITSGSGETCRVRYGEQQLEFQTKKGATYRLAVNNGKLEAVTAGKGE